MLGFFLLPNTLEMPLNSSRSAGPGNWFTAPGGGPECLRKSAKSDVARLETEAASRGSNFFIGTRPPAGPGAPPIMDAALEEVRLG